MSQIPAYEREPFLQSLDPDVVRAGEAGARPFVVLADSILYPEGGGQPADRGWITGVEVADVQTVEGEVRHYLAGHCSATRPPSRPTC